MWKISGEFKNYGIGDKINPTSLENNKITY